MSTRHAETPCWILRGPDATPHRADDDSTHWDTAEQAARHLKGTRGLKLVKLDRPCLVLKCGRCGHRDAENYDIVYHYTDEAEAKEAAREADWRKHPDGTWLCDACVQRCPDCRKNLT